MELSFQNQKQARMEFKTTLYMKNLLTQAAALDGLDLTAFVLSSAVDKARRVLNEHASISLSEHEQASLVRILQQSSQLPTPAMKSLLSRPALVELSGTLQA